MARNERHVLSEADGKRASAHADAQPDARVRAIKMTSSATAITGPERRSDGAAAVQATYKELTSGSSAGAALRAAVDQNASAARRLSATSAAIRLQTANLASLGAALRRSMLPEIGPAAAIGLRDITPAWKLTQFDDIWSAHHAALGQTLTAIVGEQMFAKFGAAAIGQSVKAQWALPTDRYSGFSKAAALGDLLDSSWKSSVIRTGLIHTATPRAWTSLAGTDRVLRELDFQLPAPRRLSLPSRPVEAEHNTAALVVSERQLTQNALYRQLDLVDPDLSGWLSAAWQQARMRGPKAASLAAHCAVECIDQTLRVAAPPDDVMEWVGRQPSTRDLLDQKGRPSRQAKFLFVMEQAAGPGMDMKSARAFVRALVTVMEQLQGTKHGHHDDLRKAARLLYLTEALLMQVFLA